MSEWKKVKIGDIFAIEKGSLQSSKNTPGKYDFITAASEWKNHNSYDHDCEAIVYAVAASGSLGRAHYVNGKFIASDLCFILTEKNKDKYPVNFLFYQIIFEMLRDEIVFKTKTGTSKESINRGNFSNYEIPYFPIDFQLANYQRFVDAKNTIKTLIDEYEKQKSYAKQLRQNILQEAIEGKLTADWRKQHPVQKGNPDYDAEALFDKIQAEMSEAKSTKKSLAPISKDEIPFEIPSGWKWARVAEICLIKGGKRVSNGYKLLTEPTPYIYIRVSDMKNGTIDDSDLHYIDEKMHEQIKRYIISSNDLYMTIVGATIGKCGVVPPKFDGMNLTENAARLIPFIEKKYLLHCLNSSFLQKQFIEKTKQVGVQKMALNRFSASILPLPPFTEQKEIVARVEKHLQTITQLETQIATRETTTKQLMQSILKDAFEED